MLLMDGLYLATGFFGALSLVWLVRRTASLFSPGPSVAAHFGPDADAALAREVGRARREVLVLGDGGPALAAALAEAQGRKAALDVLLDPASDRRPFDAKKVQARPASRDTAGLVVLIDDKVVVVAGAGEPAGLAVVAKGHPGLAQECRQQFAAHHPVGQQSAPAPVAPPPAAPVVQKKPAVVVPPPVVVPAPPAYQPSAPSPVDELLAAVARGTAAPQHVEAEEEEEEDAPVTRATADLFARLRKEAVRQEDSAGEAA